MEDGQAKGRAGVEDRQGRGRAGVEARGVETGQPIRAAQEHAYGVLANVKVTEQKVRVN